LRLTLHSDDERLRASLRALIEDLRPQCSLVGLPGQERGTGVGQESELELWDYDSDQGVRLNGWNRESPVVFLVRRQHLAHLQEELQGFAASILLKPIDPIALKTVIELRSRAVRGSSVDPGNGQTGSDLLQYLLQANLKLQEFNQDRTNFLARAVHDFRAPLTALHGYCGLLVEQKLGSLNSAQIELLERMQLSVKRVSRMTSAMFELSVGKQLERKPRLEAVDVEQCVQQALHDVLPVVDEKQIALSVQIDRPTVPPRWETGQIVQVLVNLVENACRFTPRYGSIEVRGYPIVFNTPGDPMDTATRSTASAVASFRIDVRDSGSGIEPQFLPFIFEEYTSYSGGRDRSCGGLGLAICRMIVVAHGGKIWADSSARGTVFSVVLPLHENLFQNNTIDPNPKQMIASAVG
jgi:signal transduction histidine kinase